MEQWPWHVRAILMSLGGVEAARAVAFLIVAGPAPGGPGLFVGLMLTSGLLGITAGAGLLIGGGIQRHAVAGVGGFYLGAQHATMHLGFHELAAPSPTSTALVVIRFCGAAAIMVAAGMWIAGSEWRRPSAIALAAAGSLALIGLMVGVVGDVDRQVTLVGGYRIEGLVLVAVAGWIATQGRPAASGFQVVSLVLLALVWAVGGIGSLALLAASADIRAHAIAATVGDAFKLAGALVALAGAIAVAIQRKRA